MDEVRVLHTNQPVAATELFDRFGPEALEDVGFLPGENLGDSDQPPRGRVCGIGFFQDAVFFRPRVLADSGTRGNPHLENARAHGRDDQTTLRKADSRSATLGSLNPGGDWSILRSNQASASLRL